MAAHREVLIICVNWNGREVIGPTLDSIRESTYPAVRTVVVDNGSTDGSTTLIPDDVRVIRLSENLGYGGAINRAFQAVANGQIPAAGYYLILNNDLLLDPSAITDLVRRADLTGAGVYGPKILRFDEPSRLDMAWGDITWSHVLTRFLGKGAPDAPRWNRSAPVGVLQGSMLLMTPEVIRDVGGFDERFFMYHEEVDFLYRARLAGYRSYFCPEARVLHRSGWSTRDNQLQKYFWVRRNTVYFLRKHRAGLHRWAWWLLTVAGSLAFNCLALRFERAKTIARAISAGLAIPIDNRRGESA